MAITFLYDKTDPDRIPGLKRSWDDDECFLTPVFFNEEILVKYFYDPRYVCEFCSETYGSLRDRQFNFHISFGINKNDKIIMWLGDLSDLPEHEQMTLASENIPSDHDIVSQFYDAQIEAEFTGVIKEMEILQLKSKIQSVAHKLFGINIFKSDPIYDYAGIIENVSRFKRVMFNDEDDFKRFISDWNERLVEDIDHGSIKTHLTSEGISFKSTIKQNKTLEHFIKDILGLSGNPIAPMFYLYDLRLWADHKGMQAEYDEVVKNLGLALTAEYREIYNALIDRIIEFLNAFFETLLKLEGEGS